MKMADKDFHYCKQCGRYWVKKKDALRCCGSSYDGFLKICDDLDVKHFTDVNKLEEYFTKKKR